MLARQTPGLPYHQAGACLNSLEPSIGFLFLSVMSNQITLEIQPQQHVHRVGLGLKTPR